MVAASKRERQSSPPSSRDARRRSSAGSSIGTRGDFPVATLVRMWREMLAATVQAAIAVCGRGFCADRIARLLGSGTRPLWQQHADVGLSLDRPSDPRRHRGSSLGRCPADAAGGRDRSLVAPPPVEAMKAHRASLLVYRSAPGATPAATAPTHSRSAAVCSRRPVRIAPCWRPSAQQTSVAAGSSGFSRRSGWSAPSLRPTSMPAAPSI